MRIALSMLLTTFLAAQAWAGPYDGRYRPDHPSGDTWDCRTIGQDGGAVLLTTNIFFALGSRCSLRDGFAVRGMDATLYDAICHAEGGALFERRIMIMRTDNGIAVVQKGGVMSLLRKCD
jgi:hypothetical protein